MHEDEGRRHYSYAPISIGDDVFVGARAVLMPGVRIGYRCVVAAGAVVVKSVPPGTIVGGNPARVIGTFDAFEAKVRDTWPVQRTFSDRFKPTL